VIAWSWYTAVLAVVVYRTARGIAAIEKHKFVVYAGIVGAAAALRLGVECARRPESAIAFAVAFVAPHLLVFLLVVLHWPVVIPTECKGAPS
jgi:cytochrome bd-type quinol oxidase subunit 2